MNTCKNCKHWGRYTEINKQGANECDAISIDVPDSKDAAFIDVDVSDDSGLSVSFMTKESFSCSLHSSK